MNRSWLACVTVAMLTQGCMLGGLHVDQVATSAQKPSNVAVYMAVTKGDDPALGLTEKDFHILEDGTELSAEQTQQALLPRDDAAVHRALLLVDMSGPVTEGETRHQIAMAAARFAARAHVTEPVTVYAFDGGASIRLIAELPQGVDDVAELPQLESYTPADTSSNLNSAIIESLAQLDARLMAAQKPLRIGTLVVFARGPDLAGRVSDAKLSEALDGSKHLMYAISLKDAQGFRAGRVGRTGTFEAEAMTSLLQVFDKAGERVANSVAAYYLLSYCTPARAGQRSVRIRVATTDPEGKELSGSTSTEIDASGFTSGCDPRQKPRFVSQAAPAAVHDAVEAAPPAEEPHAATPAPTPAPGKEKPAKGGGKSTNPAPADDDDAVVPPPAKPGYAQ
jgi:hypothetical protein